MAAKRRVRSGVSFDPELKDKLDEHADHLTGLGVTRSEVVNAILEEYFEDGGTAESVWGIVSRRRVRKRSP
jgi:metal-responsive CopG/Arc/MetJ family transcriptional regulator